MRRLVLVFFALALLCQGAFAALSPDCRLGTCCATAAAEAAATTGGAVALDDHAVPADTRGADLHVPCDAGPAPCDDDACHCDLPALTALLIELPVLPAVEPDAIAAAACPHGVAQHVPGFPLRPPHSAGC